MRIRTIKPEFFTHEGLFDLEAETGLSVRIAFAGLWCAADREGRFKWEPRRLGVQILPYDRIDFSRVLHALATRGFIRRYRVDDGDFGLIPSFLTHQVINNREKASELPEPLGFLDSDAWGTREGRVGHAGKAEGKGREGKGNIEVPIGTSHPGKPGKVAVPEGFSEFWAAYPRKVGKGDAERAWAKLRPPLPSVLASLDWQRDSREWLRDSGQFIPHPATWLNRRGWEDENPRKPLNGSCREF